jgi:hypothetical protein
MVVDVALGSTFTRSQPRLLLDCGSDGAGPTFTVRSYDITPDSERFVMRSEAIAPPEPVTQIHVVLNWFEELARLVPPGN